MLTFAYNAFADVCLEGRSVIIRGDGTIVPSNGEQCFENVYNQNGGTIAKGAIVVFDNTESDGYSVATSSTAGAKPRCMVAESCAAGKFCKCQTYGYTDILLVDGGTTASNGTVLYISEGNAGYAEKNASPAVTDFPIGYVKESITASGAKKAFLKLR